MMEIENFVFVLCCVAVVIIVGGMVYGALQWEPPYKCYNISPDVKLCDINGTAYLIDELGDYEKMSVVE